MTKHTPGPWVVNRGEHDSITNPLYKGVVALIQHNGDAGGFLCVCNPDDRAVAPNEYVPNAHLLAAAPDMLKALRRAKGVVGAAAAAAGDNAGLRNARTQIYTEMEAAIAKAEGK